MALHNPHGIRERVLAMGHPGAGKTSGLLHIAALAQKTGSDAKFHVLDMDDAWPRMMVGYSDLQNVTVHPVYGWEDLQAGTDEICASLGPNDWIGVDQVSPCWDFVQESFTERIFGTSIDAYFLEKRKEMASRKGGNAFEGDKDWTVINKMYRSWITKLHKARVNVYGMAMVEPVSERDAKEITQIFGPFGVRPKGQKHTGYWYDTVLLFKADNKGQHSLLTIKDREREKLASAPCKNFAMDYLIKVAGWKL